MPYRNKQMLRDANGDLIPQYWDVIEQEFKPLTGENGAQHTQVTGSKLAYEFAEEFVTIEPGQSFEFYVNGINFSEYLLSVAVVESNRNDVQLRVQGYSSNFASVNRRVFIPHHNINMYDHDDFNSLAEAAWMKNWHSLPSQETSFRFRNNGNENSVSLTYIIKFR